MTDKNFDPSKGSGAGDGEDEVRPDEEGPEAARAEHADAAGPDSQPDELDEELDVDDILGSPQNTDAAAEDAVLADLESALLNDLKRLQAEYANYRRRTEDQREREIERAKGEAVKGLLPVLDDLDRADKHGDLVEGTPFAAIGDKVRAVAEKLGVISYGTRRRGVRSAAARGDLPGTDARCDRADDPRGRRGRLPTGFGRAATRQGGRRGAGRRDRSGREHRMASQDWFDKDFYKILGVDKNVSDADLKKTYRKLARKYHPDSNQGDAKAEATFKEVSEAYSVLSDAEQRKEYDQIRAMGSGARFTAGDQPGGFEDVFSMFGQGRGGRQSPQDFDDIFSMFNQQQGGGFGSGPVRAADRRIPRATAGRSAAPTSPRGRRSTSSPRPGARRSRSRARTASRSR